MSQRPLIEVVAEAMAHARERDQYATAKDYLVAEQITQEIWQEGFHFLADDVLRRVAAFISTDLAFRMDRSKEFSLEDQLRFMGLLVSDMEYLGIWRNNGIPKESKAGGEG